MLVLTELFPELFSVFLKVLLDDRNVIIGIPHIQLAALTLLEFQLVDLELQLVDLCRIGLGLGLLVLNGEAYFVAKSVKIE